MSLDIGVVSSSRSNMGFDDNDSEAVEKTSSENEETKKKISEKGKEEDTTSVDGSTGMTRTTSESSIYATEDDDEDDEKKKIELGPQFTLKEQLEKDKDDESLRRWKEQLLGSVDMNSVGENLEPEVKILSLAIKSPGRPDIFLTIPENGNPKGSWFTLKEGSRYSLLFTFKVSNNIVSGLKYTNTVWKTGVKGSSRSHLTGLVVVGLHNLFPWTTMSVVAVDYTKEMLGTFSPQSELYTYEITEDTTPSGIFARGSYSARSKFIDDDKKCYLEINYTFEIRKDWQFP